MICTSTMTIRHTHEFTNIQILGFEEMEDETDLSKVRWKVGEVVQT